MSFTLKPLADFLSKKIAPVRHERTRLVRVLNTISACVKEGAKVTGRLDLLKNSENPNPREYFTELMRLSEITQVRLNLCEGLKGTRLAKRKTIVQEKKDARVILKQIQSELAEYEQGIHPLFISQANTERIAQLRESANARARLLGQIKELEAQGGNSPDLRGLKIQAHELAVQTVSLRDLLHANGLAFPLQIDKLRAECARGEALLAQLSQEAAAQEKSAEAPHVDHSVAREVASAQHSIVEEIAVPKGTDEQADFLLETLTLIMNGETVENSQDLSTRLGALDELTGNTPAIAKSIDDFWKASILNQEDHHPEQVTPAYQRKVVLLNLVLRGLNNEQKAEIAAEIRAQGKKLNIRDLTTHLIRYFNDGARELSTVWETKMGALVAQRPERMTPTMNQKISLLDLVWQRLNNEQKGEIAANILAAGKEIKVVNILPYLTSRVTPAELTAVPVAQPVTDNSDRTTQLLREFRVKGNAKLFDLFWLAVNDNRHLPGVDKIRTLKTPQALAEFLTANYESIRLALITRMTALPESSRLKMAEAFQNEPLFQELDQQVFGKVQSGVYRVGEGPDNQAPAEPEEGAA